MCSVDTTTCNTGSVVETTSDSGKILSKKLEEMRKDFDSVDLIFYDGRSTKNHASEVRKFVKDRYGIILP